MKKIVYLMTIFAGLIFTSCEKEEVGGTATQSMAGEWYVTVDAADESGNSLYEDFFGMGHILMNTFNTAANVATEMWVSDNGYFWDFQAKVSSDINALTFSSNGAVQNVAYDDCEVTIENGKILLDAATNPHGTKADSIVFYVSFSDDPYPAHYGYKNYKVSGYRYTGLASDD